MEIKDLLAFERIEAQELVGHLDILKRASINSGSMEVIDVNFKTDLEMFQVQCPMMIESLRRDKLYRFIELNNRNGRINEKNLHLYSFIKERIKCDPRINLEHIPLFDAVNYKLHFPCLMVQDEGIYGANFPSEPILYIFNTKELLYNLVLDGYELPKIVQQGLGIRQRADTSQRKKHFNRDLIVQTIAHIFFIKYNQDLKWSQALLSKHNIMRNFSLGLNLREKGDKRPLRDSIQKIIPQVVRKRGSSDLKQFTEKELNMSPLMIPQVVFEEVDGIKSIDFNALRTVIRTAFLMIKGIMPKGSQFSLQDVLNLPVLQQFGLALNSNEKLVCEHELMRFAKKFGHLDYHAANL